MTGATCCCYEKVRRTICTTFVSYLLNSFKIFYLTLRLPGDTGVPELQYSIFNSAVTFKKYCTNLIISNRLVKLNIKIKFNVFPVFNLLKVASIIQDFYLSNGDALSITNKYLMNADYIIFYFGSSLSLKH